MQDSLWNRASRTLGFTALALASCSVDSPDRLTPRTEAQREVTSAPESAAATKRLAELRARFAPDRGPWRGRGPFEPAEVTFHREGAQLRAVTPPPRGGTTARAAHVRLPRTAGGPVDVSLIGSGVAVSFALRGVSAAPFEAAGGLAIYRGALGGADVVHRADPEGIEDFVVFEQAPAQQVLTYDVDVSRAAGVRLVANTLELLDARGAPQLHVSPPLVLDSHGRAHDAHLGLTGCAFDDDPAPPWGRPVKAAGATTCTLHVSWEGVAYPAVVDPAWGTAGSMAVGRVGPKAVAMSNGLALVCNGFPDNNGLPPGLPSCELFDPATGSFAATGAPLDAHPFVDLVWLPNQGKAFLAGGTTSLASAEAYTPGSGQWSRVAGTMLSPRAYVQSAVLPSGDVLFAGGCSGSCVALASAEVYLAGLDTFVATNNAMSSPRQQAAVAVAGGKVLISGGSNGSGNVASSDIYDPSTRLFSGGPALPFATNQAIAVGLPSGKALLLTATSAQLWTAATNATLATGRLAVPRSSFALLPLAGGGAVCAGGQSGSVSATVETYDAALGTFTVVPGLNTARYGHGGTNLADGRPFVVGGWTGTALKTAEVLALGLPKSATACTVANDCANGLCVDGYCCDTPCGGACDACNLPGLQGTCRPLGAGSTGAPACASPYRCDGAGATCPTSCASDAACATGFTCAADKTCKKQRGQDCSSGTECATGACADGVCCDTSCTGACDACNIPASKGTCTLLGVGAAGSPACAGGLACTGTSAGCPTTCSTDTQCLSTHFCARDGSCQPRKALGQACNVATDCAAGACRMCESGICADGVCCDRACNGACEACTANLKASSAGTGTCGSAAAGTNPHNGCVPDANYPTSCLADGRCDGVGACRRYAPKGTAASSVNTCVGNAPKGLLCDGNGNTMSGQGDDCSPALCVAGRCTDTCTRDAQCATDGFCNLGSGSVGRCEPRKANGLSCERPAECTSARCVDKVCCDAACNGACEACDVRGSEGACSPVPAGSPHEGHPGCVAAEPRCGGACDGRSRECHYPSGSVSCQAARCTTPTESTAGVCAGNGVCGTAATPCNDYSCDPVRGTCRLQCAGNDDCAPQRYCDEGRCVVGLSLGAQCTRASQCASAFCSKDNHCCATSCANGTCTTGNCMTEPPHDPGGVCAFGTGEGDGWALVPLGAGFVAWVRRRRRAVR